MSGKHLIEVILCYSALKVVDKFFENNLPNLHYKNIANGFKKYAAPLLFTLYIALLYKAMQLTKNPDTKRSLQNSFIILTTAIVLTHVMAEANKKQIV